MNSACSAKSLISKIKFELLLPHRIAQRRRIRKHLSEMGAHRFSRRLRIALLDSRQDSLVMELPALWASLTIENAAALLAEKPANQIQSRENNASPHPF